ncbi:MAG TPA: hypothetical protein VMF31_00650 [Solirubrobacterales bacterium]|nr:hypothetical protein [Solirubrobacterales bacterium]
MSTNRNEKHWLTDEEIEDQTYGEVLEGAVVEIRNLLPLLESAFSGVELMAEAIRAKELGFDRSTAFWPSSLPNQETFGMAWTDRSEDVADLASPYNLELGWKLDPLYGDRLRYWWGDEWDLLVVPAPGNLDAYVRIEAGEEVEPPEPPSVGPLGGW